MIEVAAVGDGHRNFFDGHLIPERFHEIELCRAAGNAEFGKARILDIQQKVINVDALWITSVRRDEPLVVGVQQPLS